MYMHVNIVRNNLFSMDEALLSTNPNGRCQFVKMLITLEPHDIFGSNFTYLFILSNSYTMGCPPVRGINPRALASGLSYVQV